MEKRRLRTALGGAAILLLMGVAAGGAGISRAAPAAPQVACDGPLSFQAAPGSPFAAGTQPAAVAVGDFNGDGRLDLAVANSDSNNVTVLLGNGSGGFSPAPGSPFAVGTFPNAVAVGDFNGDGRPDLATANEFSNSVTVCWGMVAAASARRLARLSPWAPRRPAWRWATSTATAAPTLPPPTSFPTM